jgi:PhzF family phenazine biosynthesis protein
MSIEIYQVDAFTHDSFAGNPAGVCRLLESREEYWMQSVAREMNLSETAFIFPQARGYTLRWFTPRLEVELCGHATLASAHILWEKGLLEKHDEAIFHTRSGLLTARRQDDWIEMNFPALPLVPAPPQPELCQALGVTPVYIGEFDGRYVIEIESEATLRNLSPDFARLRRLPGRGVAITSRATAQAYDFISRYFAPWVGIDEDPVTGSAHCCLGPYWAKKLGKENLLAYQASARGGIVRVRPRGERVLLGGQAVTVLQGELVV